MGGSRENSPCTAGVHQVRQVSVTSLSSLNILTMIFRLLAKHDGIYLASELSNILKRYGLDRLVSLVIIDDLSSNVFGWSGGFG